MNTENIEEVNRPYSLRIFHIQSVFYGAFWAIGFANSIILTGYGIDILGMTKENAGLIGSVGFLAGFVQIFSFLLSNRVKNKKLFVISCGMLEALLLSCLLLPPLIIKGPGSDLLKQGTFLGVIFLMSVCTHLVMPTISNWLSGLIPQERRGWYIGMRWTIFCVSKLIMLQAMLWMIEYRNDFKGFAFVFIAGSICALVSYLILARITIPREAKESDFNLKDIGAGLHHRAFRAYLIFSIMIHIGFALACSYYGAFFLVEVGLTYKQISYFLFAYNLFLVLGMLPAGRLVDKFGSRPLIFVMIMIYMIFFFMFPFFTKERLWLIISMWGFVGIGDGLFFVAGTSTLYHSLPQGRVRIGCLAFAQGIVFLLLGIGPVFTWIYLSLADNLEFFIFGERVEKFRLMYAVIGVVIFISFFAARRLDDTRKSYISYDYKGRTRK